VFTRVAFVVKNSLPAMPPQINFNYQNTLEAVGAEGLRVSDLDASAGTVSLHPGKPVTVAFLLSDDMVESVRIIIRDPGTDTELYRSPTEIPVHLGVG